MAKVSDKKIVRLSAWSLANLMGTFTAIIGLGVAILHSLDSVIDVTEATDSLLRGLAFGLATGIVSIIVVPLIYFAIGWLVGLIQGWVYNVVLGAAGGLEFTLEDK